MFEILKYICDKNSYSMDEQAMELANDIILKITKDKKENFANARVVRNLFEKAVSYQSNRVANLTTINKEDLVTIKKN